MNSPVHGLHAGGSWGVEGARAPGRWSPCGSPRTWVSRPLLKVRGQIGQMDRRWSPKSSRARRARGCRGYSTSRGNNPSARRAGKSHQERPARRDCSPTPASARPRPRPAPLASRVPRSRPAPPLALWRALSPCAARQGLALLLLHPSISYNLAHNCCCPALHRTNQEISFKNHSLPTVPRSHAGHGPW
jgi:hypothetical protein